MTRRCQDLSPPRLPGSGAENPLYSPDRRRLVPPIYVDHLTTTPLDPRVAEAMRPHLGAEFGASTALSARGRRIAAVIETARAAVARLMDADPEEILFTGSATE